MSPSRPYQVAMTANTMHMHSWDDAGMAGEVLAATLRLERVCLAEVDAPSVPGCYVTWIGTSRSELHEILSATLATGRYPVYVGTAARSLRERLGRYRQSLRDIAAIEESDVYLGVMPCASRASAAFMEAVLLEELPTVLAELGGWGAKIPGRSRTRQRSSGLDALLPGRAWVRNASPIDQIRARARVVAHLAGLDPAGPRWDPLV